MHYELISFQFPLQIHVFHDDVLTLGGNSPLAATAAPSGGNTGN